MLDSTKIQNEQPSKLVSKKRYVKPHRHERINKRRFDASGICGLKTPKIASSVVAKSKYRTKESKQLSIKLLRGINAINDTSTVKSYDQQSFFGHDKFDEKDIKSLNTKVSKINKFRTLKTK